MSYLTSCEYGNYERILLKTPSEKQLVPGHKVCEKLVHPIYKGIENTPEEADQVLVPNLQWKIRIVYSRNHSFSRLSWFLVLNINKTEWSIARALIW